MSHDPYRALYLLLLLGELLLLGARIGLRHLARGLGRVEAGRRVAEHLPVHYGLVAAEGLALGEERRRGKRRRHCQ